MYFGAANSSPPDAFSFLKIPSRIFKGLSRTHPLLNESKEGRRADAARNPGKSIMPTLNHLLF